MYEATVSMIKWQKPSVDFESRVLWFNFQLSKCD